jgi:penicillin amidase
MGRQTRHALAHRLSRNAGSGAKFRRPLTPLRSVPGSGRKELPTKNVSSHKETAQAGPGNPPRPRRTWLKVSGILLALLVLAVLLVFLWVRDQIRGSLPTLDGELHVAGLAQPVRIDRDALGIPSVHAANRADLALATGFVHAQDRFFQMDLLRRSAAGTLAELLGPAGLSQDRQARLHGFRTVAKQVLKRLPKQERTLLQAYVKGVEAGRTSLARPPWEYLILRADPAPWTEEDTVLVTLSMFLLLQGRNVHWEATNELVHTTLPAPLADFLIPPGTSWDAPLKGPACAVGPIPSAEVLDLRKRTGIDALRLQEGPSDLPLAGSNCFAVSGAHTAHGGALVANDMHLPLMVPNIWYRNSWYWIGADGKDHQAHGITLPGTPALIVGSNTFIAWGLTNTEGDWSDLVVVERAKGSSEQYLTPDGPRPFQKRKEVIQVRGAPPQTIEVVSTIWGPLLNYNPRRRAGHAAQRSKRPEVRAGHAAQRSLRALHWVAHDPEAINFGLLHLETARNVHEAIRVAQRAGVPAMNFIVGDVHGNIGWTVAGRMPRRVGFDGRYPTSWATGEQCWDGWLSPDEHPQIINPKNGRLWSANNRMIGGEDGKKIGFGDFDLGARATQIRDRLLERERFSERHLLEIQLDNRALFLERWQQLLLKVLSERAVHDHAGRLLLREKVRSWGGRASAESVGYRIVRTFRQGVHRGVLRALTVPCRRKYRKFKTFDLGLSVEGPVWKLLQERPPHLVPPGYAGWEDFLLAVVDGIIREVKEKGWEHYTWGEYNLMRIQHPFSKSVSILRDWLDIDLPPFAASGDANMPRVLIGSHGASQRMVVAPGWEENAYFHMPGGQSGHPLSPHYRDAHQAWVNGDPTPLLPGFAIHTLTLIPRSSSSEDDKVTR